MTISDCINVALCILSFLLAAISVVTVVITLRQNHRMIENATRPIVGVTYESIMYSKKEVSRYVVVRNFGQTSATITSMDCDINNNNLFVEQLKRIIGTTLAPGQRRLYYLGGQNNVSCDAVTFSFSYKSESKEYQDTATMALTTGAFIARPNDESAFLCTMQEIAERLI